MCNALLLLRNFLVRLDQVHDLVSKNLEAELNRAGLGPSEDVGFATQRMFGLSGLWNIGNTLRSTLQICPRLPLPLPLQLPWPWLLPLPLPLPLTVALAVAVALALAVPLALGPWFRMCLRLSRRGSHFFRIGTLGKCQAEMTEIVESATECCLQLTHWSDVPLTWLLGHAFQIIERDLSCVVIIKKAEGLQALILRVLIENLLCLHLQELVVDENYLCHERVSSKNPF